MYRAAIHCRDYARRGNGHPIAHKRPRPAKPHRRADHSLPRVAARRLRPP